MALQKATDDPRGDFNTLFLSTVQHGYLAKMASLHAVSGNEEKAREYGEMFTSLLGRDEADDIMKLLNGRMDPFNNQDGIFSG